MCRLLKKNRGLQQATKPPTSSKPRFGITSTAPYSAVKTKEKKSVVSWAMFCVFLFVGSFFGGECLFFGSLFLVACFFCFLGSLFGGIYCFLGSLFVGMFFVFWIIFLWQVCVFWIILGGIFLFFGIIFWW